MKLITFLMLSLIIIGSVFAEEQGKKIYKTTIDADGIQRVEVLETNH